MELFEYIKSQLPQQPNTSIMYDMGASSELVEYVKYTPWNTNLNIVENICNDNNEYTIEDYLAATPNPNNDAEFENVSFISDNHATVDILDINVEIEIVTDPETGDSSLVVSNIHYNNKAKDTTIEVPTDIVNAVTNTILNAGTDFIKRKMGEMPVVHDYI